MTLEELLKLLPDDSEMAGKRNVDTSPGTYVPKGTQFKSFYAPGLPIEGYVNTGSGSKTAWLNNGDMETDNDPDLIHKKYVAMHEAAHTAQSPLELLLSRVGLGNTSKLSGNSFKQYSGDDSSVNPNEALADMRGLEAMMPSGKTVWDMHSMYPKDHVGNDIESYVQQTMQKTGMSRAGAQRYIDTRMFPDHQIMHSGEDFRSGKPPDWIDHLLRLFKQ